MNAHRIGDTIELKEDATLLLPSLSPPGAHDPEYAAQRIWDAGFRQGIIVREYDGMWVVSVKNPDGSKREVTVPK